LVAHKPSLPYTVTSIAAAARITPNHFSSLFHHWMGQSFLDFLNTARINAAKDLLRDLSLSISEVAHRAGYEDANYFARRFRLTTGMTPRKWRNTPAT
jgi:AraC-like DNA-binding protein